MAMAARQGKATPELAWRCVRATALECKRRHNNKAARAY